MTIIGIDASLTCTAVCIGDGTKWSMEYFRSKRNGESVRNRVQRYEKIIEPLVDHLKGHLPIASVYIEDYAFASNQRGASRIRELGGILRWHLCDLTARVVEVAPTTLKKFVTGKGNSTKDVMLAHIQRRWDLLFDSNDAGDAYGLYRLGLCAEGIEKPETAAMESAVDTVRERE